MSERARTWGLRLLALGIAVGFWLNASFEDRVELSERLIEASVSYNRPRGFVIMNQIQSVNVRLLGNKKMIRQLTPYTVAVQVELSEREPGTYLVNLSPEDVVAPEGLEVVSIEPNYLRVELEREITQRVPVIPKLVGTPAAGVIQDEPMVFPNQVLVAGPESLVRQLEALTTRPISLDGQTETVDVTVPVDPPNPLIQVVQPLEVTVQVPLRLPSAVVETKPEDKA